MARLLSRRAAALAMALSLGCDTMPSLLSEELDASSFDGSLDDAGTEVDAETEHDSGIGEDAGPDAGELAPDFDCGSCAEAPVCRQLACEMSCEYEPVPDGPASDARCEGVCVLGACETEGTCGNGWREPGPEPAREGCDDHNVEGGDACSSECVPTPFVIASDAFASDVPTSDRAVAIDGTGGALVVWSFDGDGSSVLNARRYDRYGAELEDDATPIVLASMSGPGRTSGGAVAGRGTGGWFVVWSQTDGGGELATIAVRTVASTGALGDAFRVDVATSMLARDPSVVALPDGAALVAWTDESDPRFPHARARWIGSDGRPNGDPFDLAAGLARDPALAVSADGTIVAGWIEPSAELGTRPRALARRRTRADWIDAVSFELASDAAELSAAGSESGFLFSWVGRSQDSEGDIYVRSIGTDPGASTALRVTALDDRDRPHPERSPSIAPYGAGWIVGWEEPRAGRTRIAAGGGAALPSEYASVLEAELGGGAQRDVALASWWRGTWVIWSDARPVGAETALRSAMGFILPPE